MQSAALDESPYAKYAAKADESPYAKYAPRQAQPKPLGGDIGFGQQGGYAPMPVEPADIQPERPVEVPNRRHAEWKSRRERMVSRLREVEGEIRRLGKGYEKSGVVGQIASNAASGGAAQRARTAQAALQRKIEEHDKREPAKAIRGIIREADRPKPRRKPDVPMGEYEGQFPEHAAQVSRNPAERQIMAQAEKRDEDATLKPLEDARQTLARFNQAVTQVATAGSPAARMGVPEDIVRPVVGAGIGLVNPAQYAQQLLDVGLDPVGASEGILKGFTALLDPHATREERIGSAIQWLLTVAPVVKHMPAAIRSNPMFRAAERAFKTEAITPEFKAALDRLRPMSEGKPPEFDATPNTFKRERPEVGTVPYEQSLQAEGLHVQARDEVVGGARNPAPNVQPKVDPNPQTLPKAPPVEPQGAKIYHASRRPGEPSVRIGGQRIMGEPDGIFYADTPESAARGAGLGSKKGAHISEAPTPKNPLRTTHDGLDAEAFEIAKGILRNEGVPEHLLPRQIEDAFDNPDLQAEVSAELTRRLKAKGYDGVVFEGGDTERTYVLFEHPEARPVQPTAKTESLTLDQYAEDLKRGRAQSPEHLQFYENNRDAIEARLAADRAKESPPPPDKPDVTGVAKQVTERDPQKGVSVEEIARQGEETLAKNSKLPQEVVERTLKSGKAMDDIELSALGARLRQIANRSKEIDAEMAKGGNPASLADLTKAMDELADEREGILTAADLSLNKGFHRLGMAAQIVYKPDFSLATLKTRAKAAMFGAEPPKPLQEELARMAKRATDAETELAKVRLELKEQMAKQGGSKMTPKSREAAVSALKKYFGEQAGRTPKPGVSGRERGAVSYAIPDDEMVAMRAMRKLAKDLAAEGRDLDGIVQGIREEIGAAIPEDSIYRMLSDSYRRHLIESDVARMDADRLFRDLQRSSQMRLKPKVAKGLAFVSEAFTATQRSMQAGMDLSAPFIQGRKGLFANPEGWVRSWGPMIEAAAKGDKAALERLADIRRHPMYARSKAAGLELAEPGGRFTAQEEVFAGNLVRLLQRGKYNPVKPYFQLLQRSDAAYTAFLNKLRYDTFVKMASGAPDDPAYLRDVARTINIIYGRGTGQLAEAIGRTRLAGDIIYAPRYTLANIQYASGAPIFGAETARGAGGALKVYAAQAAAYGGIVYLARLAGWDVETDSRSSDYGRVVLPNGWKVDLFAKEAQAHRLVMQLLYGKISQTGKYTAPNKYGQKELVAGQYAQSKLSPAARNISQVLFGTYDDEEKKERPVRVEDVGKGFAPLWTQQAMQDRTFERMPAASAAQFFGLDISAPKARTAKKSPPPLDIRRPGVYAGG